MKLTRPRKIKVAFDAKSAVNGSKSGVGYYTTGIINALAAYDPEMELIGYYYGGDHPNANDWTSPNIRFRRNPRAIQKIVNLSRRLGVCLPLEWVLRERVDFALFNDFLGLPSLLRTPSATFVHDLTYLDLPEYVTKKNRQDLKRFIPKQLKESKFIVAVSEFTKQRTQHYYSPSQEILVTPIPPVIYHELHPQTGTAILEKIPTSSFILTIGTIEPRKNILSLLDAYAALPKDLQAKYSLVIAGKIGWNCEAELARIAEVEKLGLNVVHVGYVSDAERQVLLSRADLFTSASVYEGFGMPILEAMASNLACAISDIPVFREVAGEAAEYFDPADSTSISHAWQKVITNPTLRASLQVRGGDQVKKVSWQRNAAELSRSIRNSVS